MAVTKPNHEAIAAENLRRQSYEYYYPRFLCKIPNKNPVIRPLFPRYMFVFIDKVWYSLRSTRGISNVLLGDDGPQPVSEAIITSLRSRENENGLVQLKRPPKFASGTKVKTGAGPLAGFDLIYEGQSVRERCRVLADMLGMKVVVEMDEGQLVAA